MTPPIGRQSRPSQEHQPVDWGTGAPRPSTDGPSTARAAGASAPAEPEVDWGVGRGGPEPEPTPGQRACAPWPAALRRQRLTGVLYALLGLVLATWSAMNLATAADAGHPWVPPWLVVVLGGAGLVSAAGYLAWAGGTPVARESERWTPREVDELAGLTEDRSARDGLPAPVHVMGTSTLDTSRQAPAGVAGAIGGFMLAGAVVCAVVALVLGPAWLLGTAALAVGGTLAIRLAGDWLGHV